MSPKSYANFPLVKDGHDLGSHPTTFISLPSRNFFPKKGNASPEKLLPPPVQPTKISG